MTARPLEHHRFADGFVVRSSLLPFDDFLAWGDAVTEGRLALRAALGTQLERKPVEVAIRLATKGLWRDYARWRSEPDSKAGQSFERAASRYFARMCSRPTPFGALAGYSRGRLGSNTNLSLRELEAYELRVSPGASVFNEMAANVASSLAVDAVQYRANPTVYFVGDELRYFGFRARDSRRRYELYRIEANDTVEELLNEARVPRTRAELVDWLASRERRSSWVDELVQSQLLLAELGPPMVSDEPLNELCSRFEAVGASDAATELRETGRKLSAVAWPGGDDAIGPAQAGAIHCALVKPVVTATLGGAVLASIKQGLSALHRLMPQQSTMLDVFTTRFAERYGRARVGLNEVLDPDAGIGFPPGDGMATPNLLKGLTFPGRVNSESQSWQPRDRLLLRKLESARGHSGPWGAHELELTGRDLAELPENPRPLPADLHVVIRLMRGASPNDPLVWLNSGSGPPAGRLMGRFTQSDVELREWVRAESRRQQARNPDAIYADVVHLPARQHGDVVSHARLFDYQIVMFGMPTVAMEHQLTPDDLYLHLDNGRLVLTSKSHGREVIPRLSHAHNYFDPRNLPAYQLFGHLQGAGCESSVSWHWGSILSDWRFLPRVRVGNAQLAPASWLLDEREMAELLKKPLVDRHDALLAWKVRYGVPRIVGVPSEGDLLVVDLENALSVESVVSTWRTPTSVRFSELPQTAGEWAVEGPGGHFANELVLMLSTDERSATPTSVLQQSDVASSAMGADRNWVTIHLECGRWLTDSVLRDGVQPLLERLPSAQRWFFVRYAAPTWHLRLRVLVDPAQRSQLRDAMDEMAASLLESGLITGHQFHPYHPEVDRYGGRAALDVVEQLFTLDSEAVLKAIVALDGSDDRRRWSLGLAGVGALLDLFEVAEPAALLGRLQGQVLDVLGVDAGPDKASLGSLFRRERPSLEKLLDPNTAIADAGLRGGLQAVRERDQRSRPLVQQLTSALGREAVDNVVEGLVHMHLNRLLVTDGLQQEWTIYELLRRMMLSRRHRSGRAR